MVQSKSTTVKEYLAALPADRRKEIAKVRSVVRRNLPKGYREMMAWGSICYAIPLERYSDTYNKQPLGYAGLAAQKCMGKSCLHFRKADDLPLDAIGEIIASTPPKKMIAMYEKARPKKR